MEKLYVNDNCIGCGMCAGIDPEHFEIVDGLSVATNNDNLESDVLKNAVDSCPTSAIVLEECDESCDECCCEDCDESCECCHQEN